MAVTRASIVDLAVSARPQLLAASYRMLGSVTDAARICESVPALAWKMRREHPDITATWLAALAVRRSLEFLESPEGTRRMRLAPVPRQSQVCIAGDIPWLEPFPDSAARDLNVTPGVATALQHLSLPQRSATVMRYHVGLSSAHTADALGITNSAANSAIQRGRGALQARLVLLTTPPGREAADRVAAAYCAAINAADRDATRELLGPSIVLTHQPGAAGNDTARTTVTEGREAVLASWEAVFGARPKARMRLRPVGHMGGYPVVLAELKQGRSFAPFALEVLATRNGRIAELANFGVSAMRYFVDPAGLSAPPS